MQQIALKAGVSVPTAKNVLSTGSHLYRESTRAKVLRAAEELGYRPNSAARAVSTGSFGAFSLLMSVRPARSVLPSELLTGIQEAMVADDLHLTLATLADDRLTDAQYVPRILREHASDGILINYNWNFPPRMVELIAAYRIPSVWINARSSANCIHPDDFGAAMSATEELLSRGHERVVYVDFTQPLQNAHFSGVDRLAGYAAAMRAAGREPRRVGDSVHRQDRAAVVAAFLPVLSGPDAPTALVAYSGFEAELGLHVASKLGLRVPEDVSLIAIDGTPLHTFDVQVSTQVLPNLEIGKEAVAMLQRRIKNGLADELPRIIPTCRVAGNTVVDRRG